MKVSEIMARDVFCCSPEDSMAKAAQVMWEHDCGCVPITDEDRKIRGIITDRDIAMAAYTTGHDLHSLRVKEAMATDVKCCKRADELDTALESMKKEHVHRLPVVDQKRRIVGVLSLADALQASAHAKAKQRKHVSEKVLEAMTEVTRPRRASNLQAPVKPAMALPPLDITP